LPHDLWGLLDFCRKPSRTDVEKSESHKVRERKRRKVALKAGLSIRGKKCLGLLGDGLVLGRGTIAGMGEAAASRIITARRETKMPFDKGEAELNLDGGSAESEPQRGGQGGRYLIKGLPGN